jgi:WD40 repeat protein
MGDTIDVSKGAEGTAPDAQAGDARFGVFLSHSSRDKPTVERIARALKEAGIEPWFDKWHLTPGGDWQSEIAVGLRASRSCAVFVGAEGLGDWERQELGLALDHAAKDRHFRVFAVLLPGVAEPFDPTHLPPFISTRTWVDFRRGFNERRVFQRLVNAVVGIPVGAEEEPAERTDVCPYRGLQTFDEEHAEFFFGREADVQRLLERLKERRFLAVLGPSGSGKSSLVRAGLVPALRRGALPGSDAWRVMILRPGAEPLTTLAAQLLELSASGSMQSTVDLLEEDHRTLHLGVAQAFASRPHDEHTVWVIDQFEEVFTLCREEKQRRAFFGNLLHAAFAPGGKAFVVLTMRADFYPKCAAYPELAQGISGNQFLAWPMEEWSLAEAIEEPARAVGLALEEGLTDQILSDLREAPGALPLMEHTLLELWERRRGSMLTLEAYREAGGVAGSLAKRADLVYEQLPEAERVIARRVLLRLTQPGEGTEDTRRRAAFEELVGASGERDAVEHVVSALTQARLLTTGTDPSCGDRLVDVSHEALIRGWPRLREWLDEDRTGLRTHRRLTEAAHEWARAGRDPEALYRGVRLAQASEWAELNQDALNALEAEFLKESVETQEGARLRSQRRARVAAGALAAGLVIVGALALLMVVQKGRADEQRNLANSREFAATSLEQLDRDPQLSLILAIKAYEFAPTAQAQAAVRRALVGSHLRRIIPVGTGEIFFDLSPDGKTIATGTASGEVALWDQAAGRKLAVLEQGSKPSASETPGGPPEGPGSGSGFASFSPNGKLLFTTHQGGQGRIWSVPDRRLVTRLDGAGFLGSWARDGRSILTPAASPKNEPFVGPKGGPAVARLWDAATGDVRAQFRIVDAGPFPFFDLSPDGRLVAAQDGARVLVIRVSTGRTVGAFEGHLFESPPFSPDGRLLVTDGEDESASVFEIASGRRIRVLRPGSGIYDATFSPDGKRILTGNIVGARIWELSSDRFIELSGHAGAVVNVAFSGDGSRLLTSSEDNTARVWDAETGRVLGVLAFGQDSHAPIATISRDGRFVVSAAFGAAAHVRVWEVGGEAAAVLRGHEAPVTSVRFSPNGRSIISADVGGGTVRVWDAQTARQMSVLRPRGAPGDELLLFAEFSADGRLAVTSGSRLGPPDKTIEKPPTSLWDLSTGKVRRDFRSPQADPLGICDPLEGCTSADGALSPDGTRVATVGGDGLLHIWDAANGRALKSIELTSGPEEDPFARAGGGVEWTPDGKKIVALTGNGVLHIFDAATYRRIRDLKPKEPGEAISSLNPELSPDGKLVGVGYPNGTAAVWETTTGRQVAELPHAGPVYDVSFSSDGRFLVTASGDAPTIWDLESQRPLGQLFGHRAAVLTVDFSPRGSAIVSAGEDTTIRTWRCAVCAPIDELLRLARERVLRELTPAERAKFLPRGA